jgi:hypothetical protein
MRKKCEAPVKPGFCVFTGVFEGCFGESAFVAVVFCWCKRGGMRGKRGVRASLWHGAKSTPSISTLFLVGLERLLAGPEEVRCCSVIVRFCSRNILNVRATAAARPL